MVKASLGPGQKRSLAHYRRVLRNVQSHAPYRVTIERAIIKHLLRARYGAASRVAGCPLQLLNRRSKHFLAAWQPANYFGTITDNCRFTTELAGRLEPIFGTLQHPFLLMREW